MVLVLHRPVKHEEEQNSNCSFKFTCTCMYVVPGYLGVPPVRFEKENLVMKEIKKNVEQ